MEQKSRGRQLLLELGLVAFGLFYIALVLAFNTALIDVVVSPRPDKGIGILDSASRAISSIAFGVPITFFVIRKLQLTRFLGVFTTWFVWVMVFVSISMLVTSGQRKVADYFVSQTSPEERTMALGAIIGTHALAVGSLSMPNLGLDKLNWEDPASKVAAVFFIPYLVLTGQGGNILKNAGALMERSAVRNNQLARPLIEKNLSSLCDETTYTYDQYLDGSKKVQTGIAQDLKRKYFNEYRDKYLGYRGSLPPGLDYKSFITHRDIQYIIREKFIDEVDAFSTSAQFNYIFPKAEQKTSLVTLFDRKEIDPCIDWEEFMREYGAPTGRHFALKVDKVIQQGSWDGLPEQGDFDTLGEKAVYGLIVPPMGMVWTLLAASLALGVVVFRSVRLLTASRKIATYLAGIVIVFLIFIPFAQKGQYVDLPTIQQGFDYIEGEYGVLGKPIAFILEWSVRMAPILYPLGYFTRTHSVGSLFGLDSI